MPLPVPPVFSPDEAAKAGVWEAPDRHEGTLGFQQVGLRMSGGPCGTISQTFRLNVAILKGAI